ncbi:transcriptional regulator family: Fungal Specific TF [Trichoderma aggressivum f. europaeum]|uniref:Transcriptional regulator family: Fungal Specific TF n=1 Tax=Trichoderma aggressivum f. europaeum TaxID=173218 RepID=A0AAE1M2P4_9HYPO|nr:transcriptional regulator family: Fungal Specific TF [Trichoderma aggressivum f. europaeum]
MSTTSKTKNLPPLDAAVFVLKWAKENHSNYIVTWLSHILPLERLIEICQKVYFSVHGYTEIEFILANGSFYWLYAEYAIISKQTQFHEYGRQCCENFQDAFSRLPFLLPASMEVIAAMAMGSLHAIELCKDLLAWTFSSSASHLCQTLGFHQNSFLENDREDIKKAKQRLFFTIYRIDKSLSLRLGRSSNIQEYNVPLPCDSMDMRWNKSANIQGRVYDELYSSFGLSRSYSDRLQSVKSLSGEIQMLLDVRNSELDRASYEQSDNSFKGFAHTISSINTDILLKAHLAAEQVELLSVLTLIHRAVLTPDSGIPPDCFEAASKAMDAHQHAIATLQACTDEPTPAARYINRIILNMPFVPFIVLFRQCIEASNPVDLARLCDFVTSLQPLEFSSKPARSRQRLFQLLHKVAQLYVESGSSPKIWNQGLTDDEFNHYLNILGFTTTVSSSNQELVPTITNEFTNEMIP